MIEIDNTETTLLFPHKTHTHSLSISRTQTQKQKKRQKKRNLFFLQALQPQPEQLLAIALEGVTDGPPDGNEHEVEEDDDEQRGQQTVHPLANHLPERVSM